MRTVWAKWGTEDMQDAAGAEARAGFDALEATARHFLEPLPYYGAFAEYEEHLANCPVCSQDALTDCTEGAEMLAVARTGIEEQAGLALSN